MTALPAGLPDTMTAIEITEHGGPEVLKPARRPVPAPGDGEVLIRTAAAGVNRPDLAQRAGSYPPPPGASDLPGLEVAGEIAALGDGAAGVAVGDRVCALAPGGGYAEYCALPAAHCLPVPRSYDMVRAAALPETFFTVWTNVFMRGRLQSGETLLVHGGASGIGTTAIQVAAARGATVLATAGTVDKCAACEELGAARAINYRNEDFVDIVNDMTGGRGADVILDMVAGPYVPRNQKCLALDGRLVTIALLGGAKAEVNFGLLMMKRQTFTGSTLRPQSVGAKAAIADGLRADVWPLLESGRIAPVIQDTFDLKDAAAAHAALEAGDHIGKFVLTVA
ncbi:MAG: NAD(P)H-quinone oxidoreductase [Rhodospirillaceae bacterium]|nr:NAD(P)H-quinone oxidoreductase [Rhodospirillaceae bacterium]MDE0618260.1 NAD(P)H-quinone oxidoreductase [Rhodospirillaceae bacterium]